MVGGVGYGGWVRERGDGEGVGRRVFIFLGEE